MICPLNIQFPSIALAIFARTAGIVAVIGQSVQLMFSRRSFTKNFWYIIGVLKTRAYCYALSSIFVITRPLWVKTSGHHPRPTWKMSSFFRVGFSKYAVNAIAFTSTMRGCSASKKVTINSPLVATIAYASPSRIGIADSNKFDGCQFAKSLSSNINSRNCSIAGNVIVFNTVLALLVHGASWISGSSGSQTATTAGSCAFYTMMNERSQSI